MMVVYVRTSKLACWPKEARRKLRGIRSVGCTYEMSEEYRRFSGGLVVRIFIRLASLVIILWHVFLKKIDRIFQTELKMIQSTSSTDSLAENFLHSPEPLVLALEILVTPRDCLPFFEPKAALGSSFRGKIHRALLSESTALPRGYPADRPRVRRPSGDWVAGPHHTGEVQPSKHVTRKAASLEV